MSKFINIPNSKKYLKRKYFSLKDYKEPYFFKEVKGHKIARYPKFKDKKFWKLSNVHKNKKLLVLSGPGRSGNHLLNALIDGNQSFASVVGEDSFLSVIFALAIKNEKKLINNIRSGNFEFYRKLSQFRKNFNVLNDKWLNVYKTSKKFSKKNKKQKKILYKDLRYRPSGNQPLKGAYILDYRGFIPNLNYKKFKVFFNKNKKKLNDVKNIFDFIFLYQSAIRVLMNSQTASVKYDNILFNSGMRRESYFLLKNFKNTTLVCPIRRFESMLISYIKARHEFNINSKLKKKHVLLYWDYWRHKVIDYLILQKKFPRRVFLLSYENLVNFPEKSIRSLFKKLGVKFNKINKIPTIQKKLVGGNSSFNISKHSKPGVIYKNDISEKINLQDKIKSSKEYFEIIKYLKKKIVNN